MRPNAAMVLNAHLGWGMPDDEHECCIAALRSSVNAGPGDVVCLLPDGTLSVAVTAFVLPQDLTRPDPPLLHRIPRAGA